MYIYKYKYLVINIEMYLNLPVCKLPIYHKVMNGTKLFIIMALSYIKDLKVRKKLIVVKDE